MNPKSVVELVEDLRRRELRATEVLSDYIERIEELDPQINAFITLNEEASEEAESVDEDVKAGEWEEKPLAGLPIAVKDNVETGGIRTTFGSKLYEDHVPEEDAVIVERLKEAGAVVVGKTNLPEFGLMAVTDNQLLGPTKNPWNLNRTPGGSSGGSAAAVAADMVPAATGNDGGGSIRIPASFCGLYGLKPSFGRIPSYPRRSIFTDLHSEGFLTRYVEDTALLLDVVAGWDARDMDSLQGKDMSYLDALEGSKFDFNSRYDVEMAFSPDLGYAVVEPEVEYLVREAVSKLEEICKVEEVEVEAPKLEEDLTDKAGSEVITMMEGELEEWKEVIFPPLLSFLSDAESVTLKDYIKIEDRKKDLWTSLRPVFEEYDFLVTPTAAVPPFEVGKVRVTEIAGEEVSALGWMPFTYPFNFTAQPAASVPAGLTGDGLPVGMQIVGRHFDDLGVLKISKAYQEIDPWQDEEPKVGMSSNG